MMPQFCAVINCRSNSLRDNISFYRFPSETDSCKFSQAKKERRDLWIRALSRNDLTDSKLKNQRICERHFVSGSPAPLEERSHPDWVPSQHLGQSSDREPDRHLSEETRKLHITPLLDHNYASKPPNLKKLPVNNYSLPICVQPESEGAAAEMAEMASGETASEVDSSTLLSPPTSHSGMTPEQTQPSMGSPVTKDEPGSAPTQGESDAPEATEPKATGLVEEPAATTERQESQGELDQAKDGQESESDVKNESVPGGEDEDIAEPPTKEEKHDSWQGEDYITRCICGFDHDDGYMISCDKCMVWQHVDCVQIERDNIPDEYLCELCAPREVDRAHAIGLQRTKKKLFDEMLKAAKGGETPPSSPESSEGEQAGGRSRRRGKRDPPPTKRKKPTKPPPPTVKKKKTLSKREIRPVRREYPPQGGEEGEEGGEASEEEGLRDWIDSYEEAITNHYSPELRARVSVLKSAEIHAPHRLMGVHSARSKVRLTNLNPGNKVVISNCPIPTSHPIMEIRGKYMLAKGEAPPQASGGRERFVFHHRLIGPGQLVTPVQVDTSTYGNAARFLRSSCTPNAQILHCIEKGTLHLYVVSTKSIEARKEITLPHRPGADCALGEECHLLATGILQQITERKRDSWPVDGQQLFLRHIPALWRIAEELCCEIRRWNAYYKKRRSRKQILIERISSREFLNNNVYKELLPQRKRSSSSERPYPSKSTKGGGPSSKVTKSSKPRQNLRSAITSQLKRSEHKFAPHSGIKKP